jgi:hypothetical protein
MVGGGELLLGELGELGELNWVVELLLGGELEFS